MRHRHLALIPFAALIAGAAGAGTALARPFHIETGDDMRAAALAPLLEVQAEPRTPSEVRRILRREGWAEIEFIDRKLPRYVLRACDRGKRFRLTVNRHAVVTTRKRIGRCDGPIAGGGQGSAQGSAQGGALETVAYRPNRVRQILRDKGWRDIEFTDRRLPVYVVRACNRNGRFELRLNRFGKIQNRNRIGPCASAGSVAGGRSLTLPQVRRVLNGLGYREIRFRDRELPVYVADACKGNRQFRLRINRRGDINFRNRIGRCGRGGRTREIVKKPGDIRKLLLARGFNRIKFTDRQLPVYVVEACKNYRRYELRYNRLGEVRNRRETGRCAVVDDRRSVSLADITDSLRQRRYYRIRWTDRALPWYDATACRNRREFSLRINRWGDIARRRQTGVCAAPVRREFVAAAPRIRFDFEKIRKRTRIEADECQDFLESLLEDNTILFAVNSARINSASYELLDRLAFVAQRCPGTNVEIAGHTDADGSRVSNQNLSERRAESVVDYLIDKEVPEDRMRAAGYGEDRPIASNTTSGGKARNRRIEFVVNWGAG